MDVGAGVVPAGLAAAARVDGPVVVAEAMHVRRGREVQSYVRTYTTVSLLLPKTVRSKT